ncbi:MAG TPA: DUF116 domain-containing protein [Acidobacteriota bacterium]|nr:DUF116 domain-containing protein [Acidobacteriota bacterium]
MKIHPPTYRLGPEFYDKLTAFVQDFVTDGFVRFADEFSRLDEFIAGACADRRDRDDHSLRRSARELYLLEAVAFKIYDELNREAFNRARDTLIVLPDCLSLHNPDCRKTDGKWGDECRRCVKGCQAHQVSLLGERFGVRTVYSKRKLSEQIEHYRHKNRDLAVVGIACLMMLATGMRTAADVGVPARGVLLNFTGCEHWNDRPFASQFQLKRLKAVLEEKYGPANHATDD